MQEQLIEKLDKTGRSAPTIKNYVRNLQILNDNEDIENLNFLKDTKKIMSKLSSKKPTTQRNYLIAIVSSLQVLDVKGDLQQFYYNQMKKISNSIDENLQRNEKTETQEKNWKSLQEINEVQKQLFKSAKQDPSNYDILLKTLVLSLYTLQPPRRNEDYINMIICEKDAPDDKKHNYLIIKKKAFVFNKYKNSKKELSKGEDKEIPITPELWEVITLYMNNRPDGVDEGDYFLVNKNGSNFKHSNNITYILNSIFGNKLSSSMIRHIYLSEKYGKLLKEQQNDANMMSHTTSTQKDYIKK